MSYHTCQKHGYGKEQNVCYFCELELRLDKLEYKPEPAQESVDITHKVCTSEWFCNYKLFGSAVECSYKEYCDFQLPRDSRMYLLNKE